MLPGCPARWGQAERFRGAFLVYFAVSYDNNSAVLLRPGLTFNF
jgi:hypothetical protein